MRRVGAVLGTVVVVALLVAGCGGGSGPTSTIPGEVSEAELGGRWPLTVAYGTLSCDGYSVVFTAPGGTRYGLNGTAQDQLGLPPIDPIWRYQPGMKRYGLRVDIGTLIQRGLALC